MNSSPSDPPLVDVALLLDIERELVPQSDAVRRRALSRARVSLSRSPWGVVAAPVSRRRRMRVGEAMAAAVMLSALCAAAFYAGYQVRGQDSFSPARTLASATVPVLLPVLVVPPVSLPVAELEPIGLVSSQPRNSMAKAADPVTDNEGYAAELRVLQPAQRAVSRRDFASALVALAEHQQKFPSGRLTEEREALRVKALLGLGRGPEAQQASAVFRARFPRSALLGRIDQMLGLRK